MRLLPGKRDLADKLVKTGSADLSYSLARRTRFRVNVFSQRGSYSIVLRVIPNKVPTVEELGLPAAAQRDRATSATASCWSPGPPAPASPRPLAAIINKLNREKAIHIITIEDPIEYLHPHQHGHHQPARGGLRHPDLRPGPARGPAPGAQGDPGGRDARRGDDLDRAGGLGDGPPGALHAAHHRRRQDHRPHRGRVPQERGAPDPHALLAGLQVGGEPAADPQAGRRPHGGLRDPALHLAHHGVRAGGRARGQEPDRRHGGRRARGHADLRRRAGAADQRRA